MKRAFLAMGALVFLLKSQPVMAGNPIPMGRLLASNCFQCHGTDGRQGFEALAGMSASEFLSEMREMKFEDKGIMSVHAKAYTDAELRAMAAYFSSVPQIGIN